MSSPSSNTYHRIDYDQAVHSGLHHNLIDLSELSEYTNYYYSTLNFGATHFERWRQKIITKKLRGEIAVAVTDPEQRLLLHTKSFYPEDAYRIPTGGINADERLDKALTRELYEETGFHIITKCMKAVILYEYRYQNESLGFITYLFHIKPDHTRPEIHDKSELITGFKWVPLSALKNVIDVLHSLPENGWHDWGKMRAVSHHILLKLTSDGEFAMD